MKQYTKTLVPDGYWVDARGALIPVKLIREIDLERDRLVGEIMERARTLNAAMRAFKMTTFGDIQAFVGLSVEKYHAKPGGRQGNIVLYSFDGKYKIQHAVQKTIAFDERLQAAKKLIDECLAEWTAQARPEVIALIDEAFRVDKSGEVSTARVLGLRRLDIEDERWQSAMQAIGEAVQVVGSKKYLRVYERVGDTDQYVPLSLDLATV